MTRGRIANLVDQTSTLTLFLGIVAMLGSILFMLNPLPNVAEFETATGIFWGNFTSGILFVGLLVTIGSGLTRFRNS